MKQDSVEVKEKFIKAINKELKKTTINNLEIILYLTKKFNENLFRLEWRMYMEQDKCCIIKAIDSMLNEMTISDLEFVYIVVDGFVKLLGK